MPNRNALVELPRKHIATFDNIIVVFHSPATFFQWSVDLFIREDKEQGWNRWELVARLIAVDGELHQEDWQFPKDELDKVRNAAISKAEKMIEHVHGEHARKTSLPCQ